MSALGRWITSPATPHGAGRAGRATSASAADPVGAGRVQALSGLILADGLPAAVADPERTTVVSAIALALLAGILVLIVFLVASYILVRSARRRREEAWRAPAKPTANDDVWSQHTLPEDWDEDDDEGDDPAEAWRGN